MFIIRIHIKTDTSCFRIYKENMFRMNHYFSYRDSQNPLQHSPAAFRIGHDRRKHKRILKFKFLICFSHVFLSFSGTFCMIFFIINQLPTSLKLSNV